MRTLSEIRRRPTASLIVVIAVAFSCLVGGLGAGLAAQLFTTSGALARDGKTPDLVQMHSGNLTAEEHTKIIDFAKTHADQIAEVNIQRLAGVDSSDLYLTPEKSESSATVDYSLVTQNNNIDILIDAESNNPAVIKPGEIGIPIDLARAKGIEKGDTVSVGRGEAALHLKTEAFIRDSMMNTSLASARRLLVAQEDQATALKNGNASEYLVEFRLADGTKAADVQKAYANAELPGDGPTLTKSQFTLISAISDGMTSAVILVVAGLMALIAALVVSVTVRTAVATQMRQIGMLRAIGIPAPHLRKLVLGAQQMLILLGALIGGALAAALIPMLTDPLRTRLGGDLTYWPFVGVAIVVALAVGGGTVQARRALKPALRKNPLEVMRDTGKKPTVRKVRKAEAQAGTAGAAGKIGVAANSGKHKFRPAWWLVARTEMARARMDHFIIGAVAFAAVLLMCVPAALRDNALSDEFAKSTGLAISDIRADLRATPDLDQRTAKLVDEVKADPDITKHVVMVTEQIQVKDTAGDMVGLAVDSGDHSVYPLKYVTGRAPTAPNELALSELNADELGVQTGDTLVGKTGVPGQAGMPDKTGLKGQANDTSAPGSETPSSVAPGAEQNFTIVGVYRDVGQAGKTAKGMLPPNSGPRLWTVVLMSTADGANTQAIIDRYTPVVEPGRVLDAEQLRTDLLGGIIDGLSAVYVATIIGALLIVALVTLLFVRLFMVRAQRRRSVMQALGGPPNSYRTAMLAQLLLPSTIGAVLAIALAWPLTTLLMAAAGSMFGSGFPMVTAPWLTGMEMAVRVIAVIAFVTAMSVQRVPASVVARDVAGQED